MKKSFAIALAMFGYTSLVLAHGDHSAPGALPFAPHGGKVAAAEHTDSEHEKEESHEHDEKETHEDNDGHEDEKRKEHEEELELYFEGVYNPLTTILELYPLIIDPKNPGEFTQKTPDSGFSDINVRIEFPRSRKFESIQVEIKRDEQKGAHWVGKIPPNKDIRFYTHISVIEGGEKKLARIHLEKRR